MLSALVPMAVDRGLNRKDVLFGNSSFSNGKRQHFNCISERNRGRQQKMHGNEKNYGRDMVGKMAGTWVEMKNRGLKIGEILAL